MFSFASNCTIGISHHAISLLIDLSSFTLRGLITTAGNGSDVILILIISTTTR
jgi:hypothetical protein